MSVSRAVAALGRRHRLTKKADTQDARRILLWLNATGLRLYRTIGAPAAARETQLFGKVNVGELGQLHSTIDKLIAALSEPEQT
jgi:DNA-binding MarR family transcriptional regulator